MDDLILTIGDKNLSSWSLRPWLLLTQAGIPFTEDNIRLDRPETRGILSEKSPSGLVPFLTHGDVKIWDSLAIMEYLNELFPEKQLWPEDPKARAIARSVSAEMHSGFAALRTVWPMMFTREGMRHLNAGGVQRDVNRINDLWTKCRKEYGNGGDFLFGKFSIADAMYAPVVSRFVTYGPVALSPEASAWRDMMFALPAMKAWGDGARKEISA
ncbi:glutathione S-transferase family protein [Hyphococcus flavus]|uniref:Glutathione S-transferase family protein n=1 Tax=Hyphococcus flavus TaxID=1866326 RepID=A0AAE9ZG60_9PROT|nr:glutathione S-transferase family protein [Hyphococcus flavus]WDI30246.1 glutathione S-transferase family protein [Hyphococcus flavus]